MATSIIQGGPGFPVLLPAAYSYICSEEYMDKITDIPDPLVSNLLDHVRSLLMVIAIGCGEGVPKFL